VLEYWESGGHWRMLAAGERSGDLYETGTDEGGFARGGGIHGGGLCADARARPDRAATDADATAHFEFRDI
jgi:hypothetical protein